MIAGILKAAWKPLLLLAAIVVLVFGIKLAWVSHGETQYAAGYAQAKSDIKQASENLRDQHEQEKTQIERDALSRIDAARADAAFADASSGRLRTELDKIRAVAEHYTGTQPTGTPTGKIINMLADMLEESNRAYVATATEAERYRVAGESCERQYDSLKNRVTVSQ